MVFGIGGTLGPLLVSAIYDRLSSTYGWIIICLLWVGLLAAPVPLVVLFMGEVPLAKRPLSRRRYGYGLWSKREKPDRGGDTAER